MSIFGELDVNDVDDDPFKIDAGTYRSLVLDAFESEKDGSHAFIIKYAIDEPGSEFDKKRLQSFFPMPDLTGIRSMSDLSFEDADKIKRLRRHLRLGFDIPEAELNDVAPSQLKGQHVYLTVKINTDKTDPDKKYTNIVKAESERLFGEKVDAGSASLGLGEDHDYKF